MTALEAAGGTVIVVPCYNEASRIDLEAFARCIEADPELRFVFVDDGSRDETRSLLERLSARYPQRATVLSLQPNQGKAEAVRRGVQLAAERQPEAIGYWDADLATPLEAIDDLRRELGRAGTDLVMGARVALLGRQIERKPARHYAGRLFATAASYTLHLPVYDTQCGAKLFRASPRMLALFDRPFLSRWIFDVEILARYLYSGGTAHGVREYPLQRWTDIGESKVRASDFFRALGELMSMYERYPLGQWGRRVLAPIAGALGRYAAAGGVGTVLHYLALFGAVEVLGAAPSFAAGLGAGLGAVVNYWLNYHVTFQSSKTHWKALPRFLVVAALGVAISAWGVSEGARQGVHYAASQAICTVVVLVLGFVLNRAWTF